MTSGVRALAAAVVSQAVEDAKHGSAAKDADRASARAFLFADRPEWRERREEWFAAAGVKEPPRAALLRLVDGPRAVYVDPATGRNEKPVRIAFTALREGGPASPPREK